MVDLPTLDNAYNTIMRRLVDTGQAPHYIELAKALDMTMEDGKQVLHELIATGIPAWVHPGTDYIASFPPFNVLPTHYRITIEGQQKWFAQ